MDEKHEKWIIYGGAAASVVGLWFLFRSKGSASSAPSYGSMGGSPSGGGGGSNQDAQLKLGALNTLTNYQLAQEKMQQDIQIAQMNQATALGINQDNNKARTNQSLLSALSNAVKAVAPALGLGQSNPNDSARTQPAQSDFAGAGFGNVFSNLQRTGIMGNIDELLGRGYPSDPGNGYNIDASLGGGVPPQYESPNGVPYVYDGTSTPSSRFDSLEAFNYTPFSMVDTAPASGGNFTQGGDSSVMGFPLANDPGAGFDMSAASYDPGTVSGE